MKKIFEEKYFFWDSDDYVQIEVEKATSEETVKSINLKNGDYLITVKKISADNTDVLAHSLPFSAKTDIRECLKSVHNRLCWYCDIDRWSTESNDIFMTFSYGKCSWPKKKHIFKSDIFTKNMIKILNAAELEQFLKAEESSERKGERVMSDSCNITNPFQSLENVLAFSCRDWSANPEDAWIYGIIMGWGFDEDDKGKSCTDELERKFGSNKWTKSDSKRLKVLHNNWKKAKELMAKYVKEKV